MSRLLFCVLFLLNFQLAVGQSFLELGVNSFNEGDLKQASRWFDWAIKADLTNPTCYLYRGQVKRSQNDFQAAFSDFKKVVELSPKNGDGFFWMALAAINIGDYATSKDANTKAIELGSSLGSQAYLNRAQTFIRLGMNKQALADFDTVIALKDQNLMNTYFSRAELYMRLDDKRSALSDYKKVVELNPVNVQLTWDIGRVSYEIEEYVDALTYYSRAMEKQENPEAQLFLIRGEVFEKLKNYEAAIEDYTRVIEMNPNLAEAHYSRGQARARAGDSKSACIDWKKAAELGHEEAKGVIVYNCK